MNSMKNNKIIKCKTFNLDKFLKINIRKYMNVIKYIIIYKKKKEKMIYLKNVRILVFKILKKMKIHNIQKQINVIKYTKN